MQRARLTRYGLLSVTGADARAFLHAQLTNDIEHLAPERWALAGWCSAKGRLLASFLVIPSPDGFLLQLARDLAAPVSKRLAMFVLRAKVKITDESDAWAPFGVWDADYEPSDVAWHGNIATVRVGEWPFLQLGPAPASGSDLLRLLQGGSRAARRAARRRRPPVRGNRARVRGARALAAPAGRCGDVHGGLRGREERESVRGRARARRREARRAA